MVPLLWLLEPLSLLVYDEVELPEPVEDDIAGLLYAGLVPVDAGCRDAALWLPEDLTAVVLREMLLPPTVPLPVLLLVPVPLLTVVLSVPANTRSSFWVSCLGPYHVRLEKCPPLPIPGP